MQALEIVKIILGFEESQLLVGRMIFFDGLGMKFRNVRLRPRNKDCVACSDQSQLKDMSKIDYEEFCQTNCNRIAMI